MDDFSRKKSLRFSCFSYYGRIRLQPASPSADIFPVFIHFIEDFTAVLCDEYQILYAHAEFSGKINSRLYGKGHAFFHYSGISQTHVSGLMILHPDGMAQTMIEIFPVACFCDEISGGLVQITRNVRRGRIRLSAISLALLTKS